MTRHQAAPPASFPPRVARERGTAAEEFEADVAYQVHVRRVMGLKVTPVDEAAIRRALAAITPGVEA